MLGRRSRFFARIPQRELIRPKLSAAASLRFEVLRFASPISMPLRSGAFAALRFDKTMKMKWRPSQKAP